MRSPSPSADTVESMMSSKVVQSSGGFLCLACNCFLKLKSSMKRHLVEHHLDSNISFDCPVCHKGPSINDVKNILGFFLHS